MTVLWAWIGRISMGVFVYVCVGPRGVDGVRYGGEEGVLAGLRGT